MYVEELTSIDYSSFQIIDLFLRLPDKSIRNNITQPDAHLFIRVQGSDILPRCPDLMNRGMGIRFWKSHGVRFREGQSGGDDLMIQGRLSRVLL